MRGDAPGDARRREETPRRPRRCETPGRCEEAPGDARRCEEVPGEMRGGDGRCEGRRRRESADFHCIMV